MTAAADWRGNVRRVRAWKVLASLHFFAGVLIPFFTQWGGITLHQVLWLQTWFMLWIAALEVPTGAFADRFGRRGDPGLRGRVRGRGSPPARLGNDCVSAHFPVATNRPEGLLREMAGPFGSSRIPARRVE